VILSGDATATGEAMRAKDLRVGDFFMGFNTSNKYVVIGNDGERIHYAWTEGLSYAKMYSIKKYDRYEVIESWIKEVFQANTLTNGVKIKVPAEPKFKFGDMIRFRNGSDKWHEKLVVIKVSEVEPYYVRFIEQESSLMRWANESEMERYPT
jgi:hypothetical protein